MLHRLIHVAVLAACLCLAGTAVAGEAGTKGGQFGISSPAFGDNGPIPQKYTCEGSDVNPPLVIKNVPPEAKSLVLIVEDPDAPVGTWVHWVVWGINPRTAQIPENSVPRGAMQGINDFQRHEYGGPCPPSGTHRYFFILYALDTTPSLGPNAQKADLEKAIKGHVIAEGRLVGLYKKRR